MNIENMIKGNPQALITTYNGVLVADSLEVADRFGKRHADVLRSIEELRNQIEPLEEERPTQNCVRYFIQSFYLDKQQKNRKKYLLTRDGFSLLVMGFTGPAALHWKLLYIEAFNKMEEQLRSKVDIRQLVTQITTDVLRTVLPEIRQAVEPQKPPEPPKPKAIYAVVSMDGVRKTTVHYNGYDPTAAKNIAWNLEQQGIKHIILKGEL